jgi:hypothetical protein
MNIKLNDAVEATANMAKNTFTDRKAILLRPGRVVIIDDILVNIAPALRLATK